MKRSFIISLFALLISFAARAEGVISISGKVVDDKNRAMAMVNVRAVGSSIATVTNGDGEFLLKIPSSAESGDEVRFSYVGYTSKVISIKDMEAQQSRNDILVRLSEVTFAIDDIGVDRRDATSYVEDVFRRRGDNHPKDKGYKTAFYREVIKKRNSFATLSEAVVEVEKTGLQSISSDRAAIYKGRSFKDRRFTDTLFMKFQGGIVSALLLDIVKNRDIVFTAEMSEEYSFWFDQPTTIDGRTMRVINFDQRGEYPSEMLYRGKLYVDSLTMAVARMELNLNVEEHDNAITAFIRKSPAGAKVDVLEAKYVVEYRLFGDRWHFNYCNSELGFRCHYRRRLFRNNYTISSEMVVTDHASQPKKIPYSSSVRSRDHLFDSAKDFQDENFWESYNIIAHEHSIDAVLKSFLKQLEE